MRRGVAAGFVLLIAYAVSPAPAATALDSTVTIETGSGPNPFAYKPPGITIAIGDTITWANRTSASHTVTSSSGPELDSPTLAGCTLTCVGAGTYRHTFQTAGTFAYYCKFHSYMHGEVTVRDPSQPPPPTPTTRRTATTRAGATTTAAGGSTTTATLTPGGAIGLDNSSSSTDSTSTAAGKSGNSDQGSRAVVILVVALAAVAAGGGALLWRLRPRG